MKLKQTLLLSAFITFSSSLCHAASIYDYVTLDGSGNVTGSVGGFSGGWHQEKDWEQGQNDLYGEGGNGSTGYDFNNDGSVSATEATTGASLDTNGDGTVSGFNGINYFGAATADVNRDHVNDTIGNAVWTTEFVPHGSGLTSPLLTTSAGGVDAQNAWFTQNAAGSAGFSTLGSWPGFKADNTSSTSTAHFNRLDIGQFAPNRGPGSFGYGMQQNNSTAILSPLVRWSNPITDADLTVDITGSTRLNFGGATQIGQGVIAHYDLSLDLYTVLYLQEDTAQTANQTINVTDLTLSPGDELIFSVRGDSSVNDNRLVSWHSDGIDITLTGATPIPEPSTGLLAVITLITGTIFKRTRS